MKSACLHREQSVRSFTIERFAATIAKICSLSFFAPLFVVSSLPIVQVSAQTATTLNPSQTTSPRSSLWTLRTIERVALEQNLVLLMQRLDIAQAQSDITSAGLRPNPTAVLNADIFPLPGERFNPNEKQYGVNILIPFEAAGKREYRVETAQNLAESVKLQVRNSARQILLAVRLAYYEVLGAQERLKIAEANKISYERLVTLNESRLKASQISQTELSRSVLALEQAELQRRETALALQKAHQSLLLALGSAIPNSATAQNSSLSLADSLQPIERDIPALEVLHTQAAERRYDAQAARMVRTAAEANQRLQEANALVDVTLSLDYTIQQTVPLYGITAQVPIPIFNRNQGEREKAQLRLQQTDRQIEATRLVIFNEIQTAFAEYQMRRAALQQFSTQQQTPQSTGILTRAQAIKDAAEFSYKSGGVSLLEFLDAVRTYNEIYKLYVDAVLLYNKSIVLLDAAVGIDTIALE